MSLPCKKVLVCGAGGFIGNHLVISLKAQGFYVIGADLKYPEFSQSLADEFHLIDLRNSEMVNNLITPDIAIVYQLAADMGGAGYLFTGVNDANIMHNSVQININIARSMVRAGVKNLFFTSSACVYPEHNQLALTDLCTDEDSCYPANPDSEYGWEKLFSERLYLNYAKNHGLRVRIARLHNVFGPLGTWNNGREKAPAALCRKIAQSTNNEIEVWGTGNQLRSFLYIDECINGIHKIQSCDFNGPLNLGSERIISINDFAKLIAKLANKNITIKNVPGPVGVNCRKSSNSLLQQQTGWQPADNLEEGILITYRWIESQLKENL